MAEQRIDLDAYIKIQMLVLSYQIGKNLASIVKKEAQKL